jgi:hypothetical protein
MPLAAPLGEEDAQLMDYDYTCEQCGNGAMLCVSDWGYIAALCDQCLGTRKNYLKLPEPERGDLAPQPGSAGALPAL